MTPPCTDRLAVSLRQQLANTPSGFSEDGWPSPAKSDASSFSLDWPTPAQSDASSLNWNWPTLNSEREFDSPAATCLVWKSNPRGNAKLWARHRLVVSYPHHLSMRTCTHHPGFMYNPLLSATPIHTYHASYPCFLSRFLSRLLSRFPPMQPPMIYAAPSIHTSYPHYRQGERHRVVALARAQHEHG